MKKVEIGLSVYPDFQSYDVIEQQLLAAAEWGYTRVFTSIQLGNLGFERSEAQPEDFKKVLHLCQKLKMITHVDINDVIFDQLGASLEDLSPLKDLGVNVLRLDGGFGLEETVKLTLNTQGIIIEDNPVMHPELFKKARAVLERGNPSQYRLCHNFFPRNETGLDFDHTQEISEKLQEMGLKSGIFITSQSSTNDLNLSGNGVCTLEDHRYLPAELAFSELRNTGVYDIILFGDSHPSLKDLKAVSEIAHKDYCELEVWLDQDLPLDQRTVVLETLHHARVDQPKSVVRSTQTRKRMSVGPHRCIERPYLSITLDNDRSNRYEGELQITCEDLGPNPVCNVIGQVKPTCKRLLEQVKYSHVSFKLKE